jgi:SAM-dependent methyltransferase
MKPFVRRTACPVCKSKALRELFNLPFSDRRFKAFFDEQYGADVVSLEVARGRFIVAECADCACVIQLDILDPTGMRELYEGWVSETRSLDKKRLSGTALFATYFRDLRIIEHLVGIPSHEIMLLEFGMGWGFWSRLARALNFNVIGAELSHTRIEYAQQQGIEVATDLGAIQDCQFHAIFADQVFEHLPNPSEMMMELARLLKPRGIMYIKVPHDKGVIQNLRSKSYLPRHDGLHPLEHINLFRRPTFNALGRVAGLTQIKAPILSSPFDMKSWAREVRSRMRNTRHQAMAIYRKSS